MTQKKKVVQKAVKVPLAKAKVAVVVKKASAPPCVGKGGAKKPVARKGSTGLLACAQNTKRTGQKTSATLTTANPPVKKVAPQGIPKIAPAAPKKIVASVAARFKVRPSAKTAAELLKPIAKINDIKKGEARDLPPPLPPPPPVRIKSMVDPHAKLSASELKDIRVAMERERQRLIGEVRGLKEQSLFRHDEVNFDEDGTDAFVQMQDLERACSEQGTIAKIEMALLAMDEGSYGKCERCTGRIESPRLRALPFVKTCIKCQSECEGGHRGKVKVRHLLWN